jgi:hypothetical protein
MVAVFAWEGLMTSGRVLGVSHWKIGSELDEAEVEFEKWLAHKR